MTLHILTPEKTLYHGEVDSVTLPGASGLFTVLQNHAPMISELRKNEAITYMQGEQRETLTLGGGFVEVWKNSVTVCAENQP